MSLEVTHGCLSLQLPGESQKGRKKVCDDGKDRRQSAEHWRTCCMFVTCVGTEATMLDSLYNQMNAQLTSLGPLVL